MGGGKGDPASGKGAWFNEKTSERLHPNLSHPPPKAPHWDYIEGIAKYGEELYLDGTWEAKKK